VRGRGGTDGQGATLPSGECIAISTASAATGCTAVQCEPGGFCRKVQPVQRLERPPADLVKGSMVPVAETNGVGGGRLHAHPAVRRASDMVRLDLTETAVLGGWAHHATLLADIRKMGPVGHRGGSGSGIQCVGGTTTQAHLLPGTSDTRQPSFPRLW
jgi:hypothetical protein